MTTKGTQTRVRKHTSIKTRILLLVLAVSLVSTAILGAASIAGMFSMRDTATDSSAELGRISAEDSSAALARQAKEQLSTMVQDIALLNDERLNGIQKLVRVLAAVAEDTYAHPAKFPERPVAPPNAANDGTEAAQLIFSDRYRESPATLKEIGRLAHLQDFLTQFSEQNPTIGGAYIGTESGVTIIADRKSSARAGADYRYEARERPWYVLARDNGRLSWTDVMRDAIGQGMGIVCSCPVYDPEGKLVAVVGIGTLLTDLEQLVNTRVGEGGFLFLVNEQGSILLSPRQDGVFQTHLPDAENADIRLSGNPELAAVGERMVAGDSGVTEISDAGNHLLLSYHPIATLGWSVGAVISTAEVMAPAYETQRRIEESSGKALWDIDASIRDVLLLVSGLLLATVLVIVFASIKFSNRLVMPLQTLTAGVREISGGNLDHELDIRTGDEIETLSNAFNTMTRELTSYMDNLTRVTADKQRIATELNVATQIQTSMLPCIFPPFPERTEFDIYASMNAAKEVGGDFYDFFLIDDRKLAVVIADVSGKGVPAALFMVIAKTLIKNHAQSGISPKEVFENVNNQLCENNDASMFVTAFMGIYDTETGQFDCVNAGHNPPLIKTGSGEYAWLRSKAGFVLAGMSGMAYTQQRLTLNKGDRIFLYTDGVTEAMNPAGALYSDQRLIDLFNRELSGDLSVREVLKAVKADVAKYADGAEQADDITMLMIEIK